MLFDFRRLAIYLNDHYAGATAGLELAKRSSASNPDGELGDYLAELVEELVDDRRQLREIMKALDVGPDRLKVGGAWTAEKLGRLKPNGQITGYSPLSRLIELEGLQVGITGKLSLWENLRATGDDRLDGFDLDELAARARGQRERVERFRLDAARQALAQS